MTQGVVQENRVWEKEDWTPGVFQENRVWEEEDWTPGEFQENRVWEEEDFDTRGVPRKPCVEEGGLDTMDSRGVPRIRVWEGGLGSVSECMDSVCVCL